MSAFRLFLIAIVGLSSMPVMASPLGTPDPSICVAQPPQATGVDVDAPGRGINPDRPGTGWELSYNDDKTTVEAIWYTFAENGQPEWLSTGQVQWAIPHSPESQPSWSGPLLRQVRIAGVLSAPEQVGEVAFQRIEDDPTRLAVRWRIHGRPAEDECLVDRSEVGFGGESTAPGLDQGWAEPTEGSYRIQWNVEPRRQGNGQQWC